MNDLVREGSLGDILLRYEMISVANLERALVEQQASGSRIGEVLVRLDLVSQEDIDWALSAQFNIPFVRVKDNSIDSAAVALVPASICRRHTLVPLIKSGDELSVVMADPTDEEGIAAVAAASGCQITLAVGLAREIRQAIDHWHGPLAGGSTLGFTSNHLPLPMQERINADPTGLLLIEEMVAYLMEERPTSVSFQPLEDKVAIIARHGKDARPIGEVKAGHYKDIVEGITDGLQLQGVSDVSRWGVRQWSHGGRPLSFIVLILDTPQGYYVTIKWMVTAPLPLSIDEADVGGDKRRAFKELARGGRGLIVVAGRSLAERCRIIDLLLEEAATDNRTVMLLGDEIGQGRKRFPRIALPTQPHGGMQEVVAAVLEHDPDIVVIEDAADMSTFSAACKAAMRGRMVIAGVPFRDTATTFRHLLSCSHRQTFIPSSIAGIVTCRSVTTLCPHCRRPTPPTDEEVAAIGLSPPPPLLYRAAGCDDCGQMGYDGKRYLLDVIPFDDGIRSALDRGKEHGELLHLLEERGYQGVLRQGVELLLSGQISPEEYLTSVLP
ncbi:MAG TPA: ATPase, T2SS/T4P/T4SS family [Geobacterales bacterium]|nr:ATPase, T2SS/T4P/T4SS family [Geobacterales bacterium]